MAKAAGESIPEGWAVDAEGKPTTDPEAALKGSLVSMGGYKGWGFGLMAELLAAGLTGGVVSRDVKPLKAPEGPPPRRRRTDTGAGQTRPRPGRAGRRGVGANAWGQPIVKSSLD